MSNPSATVKPSPPPDGAGEARLRAAVLLEHLETHLRRMEALLLRRVQAGGLAAPPPDDDGALALLKQQCAQIETDARELAVPLPLAQLAARFSLTPFERDTLVLAAAVEFDEPCAGLLATLRGGARHGYLDPQLCLALFAHSRRERLVAGRSFEADGALLRVGLLRAHPVIGAPPYHAGLCLTLPGHLRATLRGERALSDELLPCARRLLPEPLGAVLGALAATMPLLDDLTRLLRGHGRRSLRSDPLTGVAGLDFSRGAVIALSGAPGTGRGLALRAAAAATARPLLELDGPMLAAYDDYGERLSLACAEAELYSEVLHLRGADALLTHRPAAAAVLAALARRHAVLLCLSQEGEQLSAPLEQEVLARWKTPLQIRSGDLPQALVAHLPRRMAVEPALADELTVEPQIDGADPRPLADEGPLEGGQLRRAVRLAELWASAEREPDRPALLRRGELRRAVRAQLRRAPGALTTQEGTRTAVELVLAEKACAEIDQILGAAANHKKVMRDWGFGALLSRGVGIICLFDGPPGTGKTLTAEALARSLDVELHRINVAQVVDKYIGETEKNLTRLFEQIIPERTLLLFDEADSLFAGRVKVNTSTDRYSNMAVNTLLQLVERYPGVAILTTNLTERIDSAFMRRITYKVNFEEPDEAMRLRLWQNHLPAEAPLADDVDLPALARGVKLSGGNIKNAVLRAALAAAAAGGPISQALLYEQACLEAEATGMLVQRPQSRPRPASPIAGDSG